MKKFQEMTYKERVKQYLVVTTILSITMLLMPSEHPLWTPMLTLAILGGTIIFNLYKWNIQGNSMGGNTILIYNYFLMILLCYFVFFIPYNISLRDSVIYFTVTIIASIYDYFRKKKKVTSLRNNLRH